MLRRGVSARDTQEGALDLLDVRGRDARARGGGRGRRRRSVRARLSLLRSARRRPRHPPGSRARARRRNAHGSLPRRSARDARRRRRAADPDDLRVAAGGVRLGALRRRRERCRRDEPDRRRPARRPASGAEARSARRPDIYRRAAARGGGADGRLALPRHRRGNDGCAGGRLPRSRGPGRAGARRRRRAAVRRLRHLDARARAGRGSARGRNRRRLARRRGRRAGAASIARVRRRPARGARPLELRQTRRPPRLSCVPVFEESRVQVDPPDLGFVATAVRLLRVWREQWRLVLLGLTCALITTGFSLAIPILIRHAIDYSIAPIHGGRQRLWPYLLVVLVLAVLRFGSNFTRRYATARVGIRVEARMRELLYQAYLRFPRAFYDQHATGQVVSRATNDLYPIRYFIGWGMVQGAQSMMMIVGVAIVLALVNPLLALYALLAMPLVGLLTWAFAVMVMPVSRLVQQLKADVTEAADESVVGIEMVQAFGREDDVRARFGVKARAVRDGVLRQARIEGSFLPGLLFLPTLSIAIVLWFGGLDVLHGRLTLGEFFLFYSLRFQLVWPREALGWIINLGQRATASASRSFAWLEQIDEIPEPAAPKHLPSGPLDVRFDDVRFSYGSGSEVLRSLDLHVQAGEIVAVCGPTGVGKTSLLNLLPRFYDPTGGRVLLGGVDVRDVPIAELRGAVAVVT